VSARLTLTAPAKLNLYLHITGRRADGYHLLDSLVAFATLADRLTVAPADEISLDVTGPFAGALGAGDNLVMAAARTLSERLGGGLGARLALEKNIPVSAGLGGGSADAAAALAGLAQLWGGEDADLAEIALGLGADVPVSLAGQPAYMEGIGEVLTAAPALPAAGLVLVNPGVALETAAVFARFDEGGAANDSVIGAPGPRIEAPPADSCALAAALAGAANDLTAAAAALAPEIGKALDVLAALPGCLLARMAGSGATCFALFGDEAAATNAAAALEVGPGWWVWSGALAPPGHAIARR
jgi:4-diphosphocytidyl-2-C-methyl-D-erythritol kinase